MVHMKMVYGGGGKIENCVQHMITSFINIQRLKWLGHVLRMEDSMIVKKL